MAAITFKGFRGSVPRSGERLQQPRYAKSARNIKITSGNIVPLRGMLSSMTTEAEKIATIWRYRHFAMDGAAHDQWLTFASDADVVNSPLARDEQGRVYWTSELHEPRMSTFDDAVNGAGPYPAAWFMLGIPSPTEKPTLNASGGSGTQVARSFAYTFVTALGEESGPSPASDMVIGYPDGTWTVGNMQAAPANNGTVSSVVTLPNGNTQATLNSTFGMQVGSSLRVTYTATGLPSPIIEEVRILGLNTTTNVVEYDRGGAYPAGGSPTWTWERASPINTSGMTKRIYQTEGTTGAFMYVAEVAAATTSHAVPGETQVGEEIATINTLPPPAKLTCLIALPNGCLAGISDNEVCFSDPYMPYSWPIGNRYSFAGRGVALCPVGNSVVVLTDGFPILFTGSDPEAMSPAVMETYAPCVSKRGAVNVGGGMLYPSHDGLWLATAGAVQLRTRDLYRLDEWKALQPETFDAAFHDGQYYAVYTPAGGKRQILVLDIGELDSTVVVDDFADAIARNDYDGHLYAAKGSEIFKWDADDRKRYLTEWTSVEVQLDKPRNFSVAQVHADWRQVVPLDTSVLEANLALIAAGPDAVGGHVISAEFLEFELNGSHLRPYNPPTERKVQFILFDGDDARYAAVVAGPGPFRLPAGYKLEALRVGINASVPVYSATIAESTPELVQASV